MLKRQLQYFGHLIWTASSLKKHPDAGKDWRPEEKTITEDKMVWMASSTQWTWVWASSGRWWGTRSRSPGMLQSMVARIQTQLSDWTTITRDWWELGKLIFTIFYWPKKSPKPAQILGGSNYNSISFFPNIYVFIYLAVLGLSCCMKTVTYGMWNLVPWPRIDPTPSALGVQFQPQDHQGSPTTPFLDIRVVKPHCKGIDCREE